MADAVLTAFLLVGVVAVIVGIKCLGQPGRQDVPHDSGDSQTFRRGEK
jgi:hypothetical protein